jgi:NADH-quinone oxidoreductase subunit L
MAGDLDMRHFSGLKRVLPKTRWLMLIGCLALAGAPFLGSGFFSKDEIVGAAWSHNKGLGVVMLFTAFLTAYYTFRLYFRVFEGPEILPWGPAPAHAHGSADPHPAAAASESAVSTGTAASSGVDVGQTQHAPAHGDHDEHAEHHDHEPNIMIVPLILLAIGAFFAGYLNWPAEKLGQFLHESPSVTLAQQVADATYGASTVSAAAFGAEETDQALAEHESSTHHYMMILSAVIALGGIGLAYQLHLKDRAASDRLAVRLGGLTRLLERKYWVDEIYQGLIVSPLRRLGGAFYFTDRIVVDSVVTVVGWVPRMGGATIRWAVQRGYLQGYAVAMLFGVAVILILVLW